MFSGHEIMHMCPLYGRYDRIVTTETRLFTVSLSVAYRIKSQNKGQSKVWIELLFSLAMALCNTYIFGSVS